MKRTKKQPTPKSEDVAPNSPLPVVVGSKRRLPSKRTIGIAIGAVAVLVAVFALVLAVLQFIEDRKTITIGDTKITQQDRSEYADQMSKYLKKTGETLDSSVDDNTMDTIVLNAALKDQAKKHNIVVTQADIDAYLKDDYAYYGGKAQYNAMIKSQGSDKITPYVNENKVYEEKLKGVVLSHKDLFYVSINYDSLYFNQRPEQTPSLRAQAQEIIRTKYLPLFERKASKEEIARQTDLNYLDENTAKTDHSSEVIKGMTVSAAYLVDYGTTGITFNDAQGDPSVPGVQNTDKLAAGLKSVGDRTDVVTTLAGWIGIMRAEKVTKGDYGTWDEMLKDYKQKHVNKGAAVSVLNQTNRALRAVATTVDRIVGLDNGWLFAKAEAVTCTGHELTYRYHAQNATTNANISDAAAVHYNRSGSTRCGGQSGNNTYAVNPNRVIKDNCQESKPDVSVEDLNKSDYNRASHFVTGDSENNFTQGGVPIWTVDTANAAQDLSVNLNYLPVIKWHMTATSPDPSDTVKQPNQSVTFHHHVWNDGRDTTDQTISGDVYWTDNTTGPLAGYGSAGSKVSNLGNTTYSRTFKSGYDDRRDFDPTFTIPPNAKDGDRYCQVVSVSATSQSNSSNFKSSPASCVTVQVPNTPPTGSISLACTNATTSTQTITFNYDDADGSAKVEGRIGRDGSTNNVRTADQLGTGKKVNATWSVTDEGGKTYTLQVHNVQPDGSMGDWVEKGSTVSPECKTTNHSPTGSFSMQCTDATNHIQKIYNINFSDPDGATDRKIFGSGLSGGVNGPNTSTADITGIVDSGGNGYSMQVKDVTGGTYVPTYNMSSPYCSSTPSPSTISPTATITNTTVAVGDYVSTSTGVNLSGPNTHSTWGRTFWYDNNNNSTYESGTDETLSGNIQSNQYYQSPYTSLASSPTTTIASGKTRICIQLNLYGATNNDSGGTTTIVSNPATDCRAITAAPTLTIYPQVSLSGAATLTPGDSVVPTNMVIKTGGTATATSNWTRSYWYDTNGNGAYDSGEPAAVSSVGASQTGSGTYSTSSTAVGSNAAATVNGAYTRLCVQLSLSNSNSGTTINPTSAVACKPIQQPQGALKVDVTLTAADGSTEFEPGTAVNATATVTNPSTDMAASYYDRYFWYETNGDDATADAPYINQLQDVGYYYSGVTNAGPTWSTTIPSSGTIPTRICTSLALDLTNIYPAGTTTTPSDGKRTVCAAIAKKPFVRVQLGDVFAGGSVPDASGVCGSGGSGTINTYNNGPSYYYFGSGTDVAAYARGAIDGFASRGAGSLAILPSGKELTFANTDSGLVYGGNSELTYCAPNYWDGAGSGNVSVSSSSANITKTTGNAYVTSSKTPSIDATGKVSNLQWVIANNIYIDKNVTKLSGVYIARNNIYTCSSSNGNPVQLNTMASDCNKALQINGALVAGNNVKLMRTYGTLKSSPAEIITYSPFVWLSGTSGSTPFSTAGNKYDYITALPPVL